MDKLWSEKQKETLNCLKLNATVKACNELQENSRNKIDGCQTLKNKLYVLRLRKIEQDSFIFPSGYCHDVKKMKEFIQYM